MNAANQTQEQVSDHLQKGGSLSQGPGAEYFSKLFRPLCRAVSTLWIIVKLGLSFTITRRNYQSYTRKNSFKMCGGFTCSKNALTALNILYILVAFILIGVAVYGRATPLGSNLPTIGGILACGVFLILISILGLIGAIKHHQVMLFFYMIILFLLFCVQFSIACACLAVNSEQQGSLAREGWAKISPDGRTQVQTLFDCCGFDKNNASIAIEETTARPEICPKTCCPSQQSCNCPPCMEKLKNTINYAFKLCGGIGLFFSFTEFLGVWLTVRYRNQKDPRANPSAFL